MSSKNTTSMVLAIVAGVLFLLAGITGAAAWEAIRHFVTANIVENEIVEFAFAILIFLASLGGVIVIAGGLLIGKNRVGIGKFLIALGAGIGLIGLIITIIVAAMENDLTVGGFFTVGMVGLILSIVARALAKKEEKPSKPSKKSKK